MAEPTTTCPQQQHSQAATAPFCWPPVAAHVAMLRGRQRPDAPVLLTLFPPRPQPGQPVGFSRYFPATCHQVLDAEPALLAAIEGTTREAPGYSLGLVVNAAMPQPPDWGSRPEHFPLRFTRKGQPLSAAEQQAYQVERCELWNSGRREGWCAPKQWGASIEHIGPCEWLFAECDREGFPKADQRSLAAAVFGAPPSFSIDTGGKSEHCYYRLSRPVPPADWARLQALVIGAYGHLEAAASVDGSLKKPNQVMRLAGGFHPRTGALATIHTATWTVLEPELLEQRLQALQPPPPPAPPRPLLRPRSSSTRRRSRVPTLQEIADHLATIPRRVPDQGNYVGTGSTYGHRNILWGLVKACEEAGYGIDTAISLMEAHSPSATCGWDVRQVAISGGDQASPGWFWGAGR
ncbi:MAG: hypothetical protein EA413_00320 [Cyanobium sp. PLM2.Bin73]|nr:MAG: hypothetical protein EA413_00320 [Cyanobium sp. PLM2.Bin73]